MEQPLQPAYAFNRPGASVTLYEGPISGLTEADRPGRIELTCQSRHGLRWSAELQTGDERLDPSNRFPSINRWGRDWPVEVHGRTDGEGWLNVAHFTRPDARLGCVLVHWMNMPSIHGPIVLFESRDDTNQWWAGRWQAEIDGWKITLDQRPDHGEAMSDAHETHLYVFTHVMEIRRCDDAQFEVDAVSVLINHMRMTFSFAFGRWVAPVLPVGYDAEGNVAWERWESPICDPAQKIGSPTLYRGRPEGLTDLLRGTLIAFADPERSGNTRFQLTLAVEASEARFVEQRIFAAAPALEHLAWSALVLTRKWTRQEYRQRSAADRLRCVLQLAGIPTDIDPVKLAALAKFAQRDGIDGPTAITRVRNRLIHPEAPQDQIYQHVGLVTDVGRLSRRYTTLLLLHSIGYGGEYLDPVRATGWEGETVPVPWSMATESGALEG